MRRVRAEDCDSVCRILDIETFHINKGTESGHSTEAGNISDHEK